MCRARFLQRRKCNADGNVRPTSPARGETQRGITHGFPQGEQKINLKDGIDRREQWGPGATDILKRGAARSRKITKGMEVRNPHPPLP